MLTVACVLSGPKYDESHVERLMRQVDGRLAQPYRFLCLTNEDVPCERVPLVTGWPGWWAKLELFRPGLFKGERNRVLYLDLDVTVTGPLDDLADYPAPFVICRDFISIRFNSSVMSWDAGAADEIYTAFSPSVMAAMRGDQDWIHRTMPGAATFPRRWCVSYKRSQLEGQPEDMRVLIYHGFPKPWDLEHA